MTAFFLLLSAGAYVGSYDSACIVFLCVAIVSYALDRSIWK